MLDRHIQAGYTEVIPPYLINSDALTASGQLPKFAEESFQCRNDDLWLTPTAEVPLTNLHRDDILNAGSAALHYCAYTPCFRREAGSYGKDTRGLIRLHQFNKVEMYKFVHPDTVFRRTGSPGARCGRHSATAETALSSDGAMYRRSGLFKL
jgi:seryl-tRNA synthetase